MWPAVIVASLGCYAIKLVGLSVPQKWLANRQVMHVANLLPVALLTALIATQAFTSGRHLQIDARAAGLLAAVIAVRFKAPFLVVVGLA
ncbi:MAG TPA: AzlD domain-containing protein, partial [Acidothermaceae bacterium]|nr:AzlD domain-containing protein [Acidothermaceae bacterium]